MDHSGTDGISEKKGKDSLIVNLIFELGQLRLEPRKGWHRIGIRPENVAEHSLRAAQLAYILAVMEEHPNPHHAASLAVFHDMAETRTGDPDRVAKRYSKSDQEGAARDQTEGLGELGKSVLSMWKEVEEAKTAAGKIAKDADRLEMAFTAKELLERGHGRAEKWMESVAEMFETDSARRLFDALQNGDPDEWWLKATGQ